MSSRAIDRLIQEAAPRPQALLFTLWGDYVVHRGGEIAAGSLIRLAAELGLSEPALRAVLARMTRADWLRATRSGRRSFYRLSEHGRAVIREGTVRIFRHPRETWDGEWQIVAYSIPEPQRDLRDQFRKRLAYLGFGPLAAATWISPHRLETDVAALADELGIQPYLEQFRGRYATPATAATLAARVWPLDELAAEYGRFDQRWRAIVAELGTLSVPDAQAFALRVRLIHEYQRFFLRDPELPPALLPSDWPGTRATMLFDRLHETLAVGANRFFDAVFEGRPDRP